MYPEREIYPFLPHKGMSCSSRGARRGRTLEQSFTNSPFISHAVDEFGIPNKCVTQKKPPFFKLKQRNLVQMI